MNHKKRCFLEWLQKQLKQDSIIVKDVDIREVVMFMILYLLITQIPAWFLV